MRIAIFSGSFNPIHNGHLAIAREVLNQNAAAEVWFLVSPQNPLKKGIELWPQEVRMEMVKMAIEHEPKFKASDFEFYLPSPSYTITTLDKLKDAFPNYDFILLIGGDNLYNFHKWYSYKRIAEEYGLIVYPRPGYPDKETTEYPNVEFIKAPLLEVSATIIRSRLHENKSVTDFVPEKVAEFIYTHFNDFC